MLAFGNSQDDRLFRIEFFDLAEALRRIGLLPTPKSVVRSIQLIEEATKKMSKAAIDSGPGSEPDAGRNVCHHLGQSLKVPTTTVDPSLRHRSVASLMLNQLLAGHETSSIALTYLLQQLSKRPSL